MSQQENNTPHDTNHDSNHDTSDTEDSISTQNSNIQNSNTQNTIKVTTDSGKRKKTTKKTANNAPKATKKTQPTETPAASLETTLDTKLDTTLDNTLDTSQTAHAVQPDSLKLRADPAQLPASTRSVKPIQGFIGQERAQAAMMTALNINASGYNVFASGRNGLGKRTMILRLLNEHAKTLPTPDDWVYVNNFKYARKPVALSLPSGKAKPFKDSLYQLWHSMLDELRTRFRADRYLTQVDIIRKKISEAQQSAYQELTEEGKQLNLQLVSDDNQHHFVPIDEPFDDSHYVEIETPQPKPDSTSVSSRDDGAENQLELQPDPKPDSQQQPASELKPPAEPKKDASARVFPLSHAPRDMHLSVTPPRGKLSSGKRRSGIDQIGRHQTASQYAAENHSPLHDKPVTKKHASDKHATDKNTADKAQAETTLSSAILASKTELENNKRYMQRKLKQLSRQLENLEVEADKAIDELNSEIARDVVEPLIQPLLNKHKNNAAVVTHLRSYREDVITNVERILRQEEEDFLPGLFESVPVRYQVNIMASHTAKSGAPVIFEDMPTHYNLIGHVEQVTHMGSVTTDFSLIRTGSLHRANGGFLVLEAMNLLEQPYAWQGIKRALQSKQIKLSSLEQMITLTGSISLEPDEIPLNTKVVLLGEPALYYELLQLEPEFDSLFKIRADFSDSMPRTAANEATYVQVIADYVRKHKLLPFKRDALGALIEDASRQAEEQHELSLHAGSLGQMLLEANSIAISDDAKEVRATHITQTLKDRYYRMGYLRELYWHDLARGHQLISTQGRSIGQINALTVIMYADSEFGLPARLTATAHQGNGEILDVERDVNLAGSLHAKGMLIMSSYLRALFGQQSVLSFTAALTFEQNYGQIDGDSATLAECCALISALSRIGIDQSWAITGSMNQFGEVQPIGGINAKIEGFYDTCKLQGLTGSQGVIIPIQNKSQLMLRDDVVNAVAQGEFHVYAISHVNQALEKLLDTPCGADADAAITHKTKYPKDSIYGKIKAQLKAWRDDEDEAEETSKKKEKKKKKKGKKAKKEDAPDT